MAISIPDRVVVFDYGEVISQEPSKADRAALLALTGADGTDFWRSYGTHRRALDQGTLSTTHYWRLIASELGKSWSTSQLHALWVADFRGWWSAERGTVDLIEELSNGGTRLAILSNAGADFASGFRRSPVGALFERVFVSGELDLVKPDPQIYQLVARDMEVPLEHLIFIDNRVENTDAASALGITTHHFTGVEGLDSFLRSHAS